MPSLRPILTRFPILAAALLLAACGVAKKETGPELMRLYPNETPELRAMINATADAHGVPRSLVHRVIQRESDYRPRARNGPYFGLMQILPETAGQMGFRGKPSDLLDPQTNLTYAVKYLRGAWMVSDGDEQEAVMWYARGYYYEARNRCLLVETGLRDTEVRRYCG
ncbi:murein transglycosylase C [Pseudoruegeria aquimaris]|uniref:Murein transglycosylase C n=1 Tax=Pseudoruegeria aquimaris TaxID=393663 RepID=A0A1Y5SE77_9RHOB|nr:lytic transglycosylase domain-containing protein [Pseudoruegeria aquimaris]SLN37972.1 murein transglycosylase C [Pseudoruegeria aquimaris]